VIATLRMSLSAEKGKFTFVDQSEKPVRHSGNFWSSIFAFACGPGGHLIVARHF
jgi:hypothetical protein